MRMYVRPSPRSRSVYMFLVCDIGGGNSPAFLCIKSGFLKFVLGGVYKPRFGLFSTLTHAQVFTLFMFGFYSVKGCLSLLFTPLTTSTTKKYLINS